MNDDVKKIKVSNIALITVVIIFLILIGRLTYLSLSNEVDGINIQNFAKTRTTKKITLSAKRGNIYDGNGNILGQDISSYTLIAYLDPSRTIKESDPQHVVDKENTALVLSKILDMDYDTILKYLNKTGVYQTEFGAKGKGLNEITKDCIKATNLPGLDFIETKMRYYPYGDFASYLVGYAKEQEKGNIVGELGIEKYFNDELTGIDGYKVYQKDRNGYKIAGTSEITEEAVDGADIYLTIDNNIQFFVEKAISKYKKGECTSMTVVVCEAKTGKILAYGTNPSFDPNKRNIVNYMDPISSVAFEPGSTMKIYTYMAALEAGVYDGKAKYKSGTFTTKDKTVIKDWNNVGWGTITFDKGFIYSSNTAVVNIMNSYMNADVLKNYFLRLGFGSKTGIDVSMEASGKIGFKYETEIFNAAFGQGIMTTPIQHVKALTSIANNGILLKPYVVEKVVSSDGEVLLENSRTALGEVASVDTVSYVKNLMWHTINDSDGAAHGYAIKGYDIIGKTGTAQIASTNGKGYLTGASDHHRSIAIMFPKDDPQIIIYGVATYAKESYPLSNAVKEIIKNISKYYNIYGEEEKQIDNSQIMIENYLNKDTENVKETLSQSGLNVIVLGDGKKIIKQYPSNGINLVKGDKIFLLTNGSEIKLPDITGYSKIEVDELSKLINLPVIYDGNGYVSKQSIEKDTILNKDSILEISLSLPY